MALDTPGAHPLIALTLYNQPQTGDQVSCCQTRERGGQTSLTFGERLVRRSLQVSGICLIQRDTTLDACGCGSLAYFVAYGLSLSLLPPRHRQLEP